MNFGKGMPWLFRYLKERLLYKNWNASTITPWPFAGTCVITQRIIITHRPGFIMMVWIHSGFVSSVAGFLMAYFLVHKTGLVGCNYRLATLCIVFLSERIVVRGDTNQGVRIIFFMIFLFCEMLLLLCVSCCFMGFVCIVKYLFY